jgi:hypothetical protein
MQDICEKYLKAKSAGSCGSSDGTPAYPARGPEFKLSTAKKKMLINFD